MTVTRNIAEALSEHVTPEVEYCDRLYINLYQRERWAPAGQHRPSPVPSS